VANSPTFLQGNTMTISEAASTNDAHLLTLIEADLKTNGIALIHRRNEIIAVPKKRLLDLSAAYELNGVGQHSFERKPLPEKAPADSTWLSPFGPLTTKAANGKRPGDEKNTVQEPISGTPDLELLKFEKLYSYPADSKLSAGKILQELKAVAGVAKYDVAVTPSKTNPIYASVRIWLQDYASMVKRPHRSFTVYFPESEQALLETVFPILQPQVMPRGRLRSYLDSCFETNGIRIVRVGEDVIKVFPASRTDVYTRVLVPEEEGRDVLVRSPLPEKAPADASWLSPFGPLTTKAAKAAAAAIGRPRAGEETNINPRFKLYLPPYELSSYKPASVKLKLRSTTPIHQKLLFSIKRLLGRHVRVSNLLPPGRTNLSVNLAFEFIAKNKNWEIIRIEDWEAVHVTPPVNAGYVGPVLRALIGELQSNGIVFQHLDGNRYLPIRRSKSADYPAVVDLLRTMAGLTPDAWRAKHERPLALLYTYSLIIALVCGTAGLPHILVRFYTNPDGVAAKRTTMWVMILIGIFYVFPPVFGVMGRNLLPDLYAGVGAKGTDKIVLELPRLLNEKYPPIGSILSGITCAGAFAAFMSTFSGLLVSMTGALAHDVYGRMLRPKSTPDQRMRAFKICAVIVGAVAIVLGMQVEPFQINFMVGQAFAIAAASYFPLLFMSAWWRGMTMKGAAAGMLTGGLLALVGISLTSFTDLKWIPLDAFWAAHPLWRILCEQPAIWAVPLAITLMVVVSKLTTKEVPPDIRMKMLVLHAPEKLGLKQEYIQEHQHGH